ncbi:unnamed protein product, partial [Vitis vinifera]
MTTSAQPPPPPSKTQRKLIVEIVDARDLLPKDGQGSSSPYVIVDFDGHKQRTTTKYRDLNPVWNEKLEFLVSDPDTMENHFLGRVKLYGSQFAKRGEEGLVYFPLEKKSVFSWIRGEIGLRIYYYDEEVVEETKTPEEPPPQADVKKPPVEESRVQSLEIPVAQMEVVREGSQSPPIVIIEESPPPPVSLQTEHHVPEEVQSEMRRMVQGVKMGGGERVRLWRRPNGDYSPKVIRGRFTSESEKMTAYDLVEPMQYLFVRIVKARRLSPTESPCVKIRTAGHFLRSKPATLRPGESWENPEWHQVFALGYNKSDSASATLEISVWNGTSEQFLGGVCFDLSDVPVRDPPDSPLAPQWYRLEGADDQNSGIVSGDIQLSVWIGTQADDAFPESWSSDAPYVAHTRSKVYQSPKLWYLRVTVMEAQDLHIASNLPPLTAPEVRVKAQLGFQSVRTRRGSMSSHSSSFFWHEDLVFVAGEALEDHLILLVEDRTAKDALLLGHVVVPVSAIEQRIDERHVCSDFRPTAKQLWKPAVGVLELGILGARGLLPMKTKGGGKGSTDAYCVAKYGKKWVRTRTITDSFDPRWNEQYTWQVYDPCTVLTIGVFDNLRMFAPDMPEEKPDYRIGKVRIRVSTLESNKVYTNSYPLLVLQRTGLKKMGEIELAIRFACPSMLPETCAIYGQPLLPRMHYLRPLGVAQQEALRGAATKIVAAWLVRSEPPLGPEVVRYMLDADSHTWSMRKSKANWFRIVAVLAWAVGLAKWLDDIRRWKNPITTVLVHVLYLVLVWYPDLIVPTGFLYIFLIGLWYYRFRPKIPAGMDIRLSQAETVDPDELDEEFDTIPTLVSWRDPRATKLFIGVCLIVTVVLYAVPPKMVAVAIGFYFLRHPMFRDPMPPASLNFFRRLPSLSDRLM